MSIHAIQIDQYSTGDYMLDITPKLVPTNLENPLDEYNLVGSNTMQVINIQREVTQQIVGATINQAQYRTSKNIITGSTSIRKTRDASLDIHTNTNTLLLIKAEDVISKQVYKIELIVNGRSSALISENDIIKIYSTIGGICSRGNFGDYIGNNNNIQITNSVWTPFRIDEIETHQIVVDEKISTNKYITGGAGGCAIIISVVSAITVGISIQQMQIGCLMAFLLPTFAYLIAESWWKKRYKSKIDEFYRNKLKTFLENTKKPYSNKAMPKDIGNSEKISTQNNTEHSKDLNAQPVTKICPFCAEEIKYQAIICRHCGSDLSSK